MCLASSAKGRAFGIGIYGDVSLKTQVFLRSCLKRISNRAASWLLRIGGVCAVLDLLELVCEVIVDIYALERIFKGLGTVSLLRVYELWLFCEM